MLVTRGKKRYLYASRREGGKVRSVYHGSGPVAELAGIVARLRHDLRKRRAAERRSLERFLEAATQPTGELAAAVDALVHDRLVAAGYQLHARSEWRKCNVANASNEAHARDTGIPGAHA